MKKLLLALLCVGVLACHPKPPVPCEVTHTCPPPPPPPPPVQVVLPRLIASNHVFVLDTGDPFTVRGTDEFQLLRMYLEGTDIEPFLTDRTGFNYLRVFCMMNGNLGRLIPGDYPDYHQALLDVANRAAMHGMYVEYTVFVDATQAMPDVVAQLQFWDAIANTLRDQTNVLVELGNELDQTINWIDTSVFPQLPAPFISSHGSQCSQCPPVRPWWSYETFHTNDAYQWWRKVGHNAMEFNQGDPEGFIVPSHVPIIADENTRPDRDFNDQHYYDAAASAALLIAGSTFHSVSGRDGLLFTGRDLSAAIQWIMGSMSVSLHCQQAGGYRRRDDLLIDPANAGTTGERVYQRGFDDTCIVHIWPPR